MDVEKERGPIEELALLAGIKNQLAVSRATGILPGTVSKLNSRKIKHPGTDHVMKLSVGLNLPIDVVVKAFPIQEGRKAG